MIKYKKNIAISVVENSGNIEGRISKDIILTPEEMLDKALMFNVITLPSGSKIKEHSHQPDAEIYYMLEGEAIVTDNDTQAVIHAWGCGVHGQWRQAQHRQQQWQRHPLFGLHSQVDRNL